MRQGKSSTEKSEQKVLNWSFDEEFKVLVTEGLGYDGQNLQRNPAKALKTVLYADSNYDYICEAAPGTLVATAKWRVTRVSKLTGNVDYADGNANFDNSATDLSTVAAFPFS